MLAARATGRVAGASDRGVDAVGISSFFAEREVGVPAEVVLLGC